jgi:tRNA pseudouridine38-40 synthase
MVGSLEHVGSGKWSAGDLEAALKARERARCGVVAPPWGLYLMGVDYDPEASVKARPKARPLLRAKRSNPALDDG